MTQNIISTIIYYEMKEIQVDCGEFQVIGGMFFSLEHLEETDANTAQLKILNPLQLHLVTQTSKLHEMYRFFHRSQELKCNEFKWMFKFSLSSPNDSVDAEETIGKVDIQDVASVEEVCVPDIMNQHLQGEGYEHDDYTLLDHGYNGEQDEAFKEKNFKKQVTKVRREVIMSVEEKKSLLNLIRKCDPKVSNSTPKKVIIKRKASHLEHASDKKMKSSWWPF